MLVKEEIVKEELEVKVVYKIIGELVLGEGENRKTIYKRSFTLDGTPYKDNSAVDGVIDHKPTKEEIEKVRKIVFNNLNLDPEYLEKMTFKAIKLKSKKIKKIVTKVEEMIVYEKEIEEI